jgi:two-component sensor histidine kinase
LQSSWSKTKLEAVLKTAIEPFETPAAKQFWVRAADFDLAPNAVLPVAMVLNELCTNAVKYGALSTPKGRVEIDASIDYDVNIFRLKWVEKNGPVVQTPTRRSFGLKLIEQAFVSQLQGTARLEFDPAGVFYQLDAPIAALQPLGQSETLPPTAMAVS